MTGPDVNGPEMADARSAVFSGPEARGRAEAYARWLNAGGAHQRRRTDPGFKPRLAPEPGAREPDASGA